jgi:uncharacterized membrane protein
MRLRRPRLPPKEERLGWSGLLVFIAVAAPWIIVGILIAFAVKKID